MADRRIEQELIPFCVDQNVGVIPYFPLAGGAVPAGSLLDKNPNFSQRMDDARIKLGDQVVAIAEELGTSATALSLSWLMHRLQVATVIAGATRESQIDENLKAVELTLSEETLNRLDEASEAFIYAPPFGSAPRRKA